MAASESVLLVNYALMATQKSVTSKRYRDEILNSIISMHGKLGNKDLSAVVKCLIILDESDKAAEILTGLIKGSLDDVLMSYQIAFDIFEAEQQSFIFSLRKQLSITFNILPEKDILEQGDGNAGSLEPENVTEATALMQDADRDKRKEHSAEDMVASKIDSILSGEVPMELDRQFLARNNAVDFQILKNIKASVEARNSMCHGAAVFANAIMNAGTTNDVFLRDNLDWLSRATNWSKFSATAGLGVIHKGNIKNSRNVMRPYLPSASGSSPYSEGGALYALGIIHSNHEAGIKDYLLESLKGTQHEIVQHGACLGLGLAGIGSEDPDTFDEIKSVLYNDNAVAGEAAGLAMGMIFAGTGTEMSEEMLAYAHDTQHEKIIRGLSLGLAIIQYGREEKADSMIEAMSLDQDHIVRYGGMFTIGMAYCGTADNQAMQKLLHFAVSDVSNDVRRAAVISLGFVLAGHPELCVRAVSLLSESYNPHVRYGSAIAVGISGAGSGCKDSWGLLEPMLKDATDFVQQGALIAAALVMVEQPEARQKVLRDRLFELHGNRAIEMMVRMGSILATGILDAAGRNATFSLHTDFGSLRRSAVIGLAIFVQYWYWYPLMHAISLAIKPTILIGVDSSLGPPVDFVVKCNCKPSMFAYPAPVSIEDKKSREKVPTAILSTTARAKARAAKKDSAQKQKPKDVEMETEESSRKKLEVPKAVEAEGSSFELKNPARVVPGQKKYLEFMDSSRWQPIRSQASGYIVLKNKNPELKVEYAFEEKKAEREKIKSENPTEGANGEAAPPQSFEYIPS